MTRPAFMAFWLSVMSALSLTASVVCMVKGENEKAVSRSQWAIMCLVAADFYRRIKAQ